MGESTLMPSMTDARRLTEEGFRPYWALGCPVVVTGLLGKLKINWTPEYFIEKYNNQSCLILECQTDQSQRMTVGDFFQVFGKYEGRKEHWKLKVCVCVWCKWGCLCSCLPVEM